MPHHRQGCKPRRKLAAPAPARIRAIAVASIIP